MMQQVRTHPPLIAGLKELVKTPTAALMNLVALVAFIAILKPIVEWGLIDAVWSGTDGSACPQGSGACWAFIRDKSRLIFFGRFPLDQQWRAGVATALLVLLVAASLTPTFWGRKLGVAWAVGLATYFLLMAGGVPGLTPVPSAEWGGLPLTILLTVFGVGFGLVLSVPVALAKTSKLPVFKVAATIYVEAIRGVPLISVLFMASILLPVILPEGLTPGGIGRALAGIVVFFAAYMAEVLRGGLQSLPKGQYEACASLGLRYWPMMLKVILPQAFVIVLPAIVNMIIAALKGTSLVVIVAMMDFLGTTKASLADPDWIGFYVEAYVFAGLVYGIMCGAISWYGRRIEKRFVGAREHKN
ncbi:amino acid ABC transporter permease [Chachezhania sediminis]|uniref:amino acid ABC transporter permease n=1 Tax=Chachezhania sediminis TaxID=2599291 RepID=UPI00131C5CB6|nr:amino acid ABC transporter permease [Chachezhania sediminis]